MLKINKKRGVTMQVDIKQLEEEIERLNKKIDYLEKLDRKNFLQILTLQNKIFDYERGIK
tara:strand:- start:444 stop:623 length:180 start_codon:yes stop_codon:yes gene_type:complete